MECPHERVVPTERLIGAIFGKEKAERGAAVKQLKEEAKKALLAELGEGKFTEGAVPLNTSSMAIAAWQPIS